MTMKLQRGVVLVSTLPWSREVGIVLGPAEQFLSFKSATFEGCFTVAHGWIDNPPDCGLFEVHPERMSWRRATPEEAAKVRELFLQHARDYGEGSNAWVANEIPGDEFAAGDVVYEEKAEEGFGVVVAVHERSIAVMYESGVRPVEPGQLQAVTSDVPRPHRVRVSVPEGPHAVNAALLSVGLGELR